MITLERDPDAFSRQPYDLIIAGGGIYGAMLALEAVRRSLKPLLLERDDFFHATSSNHLRTVHGGLRYLQTLDIPRFKESIGERKWFLKYFPQYVVPMPCLMPLYGKGLHRNTVLRLALLINDTLSFSRNRGIRKDRSLPNGKVISPNETLRHFPAVDTDGLTGSALWYDACVGEYQRLNFELLKLAAVSGACFLNYTEVTQLLKEGNQVAGVRAVDRETNQEWEFSAPVVINAAGPGCRDLAGHLDKDHESLFKKRLLLWNVLFDKEALSQYALGLTPGKGKGHSYFFHPWKNRLLIGTGETPVESDTRETRVPADKMDGFIRDINSAVPGLNLDGSHIQKVYSGILPAENNHRLSSREAIYDHSTNGGPKGLVSVSGVKFTTSRLVAEKTMHLIFPRKTTVPYDLLTTRMSPGNLSFDYEWEPGNETEHQLLKTIIRDESVQHLSDLVLRRTSLGDNPEWAIRILPKLRSLFQWDETRWNEEVEQLKNDLAVS